MSLDETHPEHPLNLIPELCRQFYALGWATGTGGGISIRFNNYYYIAPSGVQKERIQSSDIFVLNSNAEIIHPPRNIKIKKISECTPLFFNAFHMRGAGACLHAHSQHALLITLLCEKEFRISHIEMIKGIINNETGKAFGFTDTLIIPIIENTNYESELTQSMAACMLKYTATPAILVRRHGIYVWGETWEKVKSMMECFDYLFELGLKMEARGIPLVKEE